MQPIKIELKNINCSPSIDSKKKLMGCAVVQRSRIKSESLLGMIHIESSEKYRENGSKRGEKEILEAVAESILVI